MFVEVKDESIIEGAEGYQPPQQFGPLRHYDREMRCLGRAGKDGNRKNCGSSTFYKLDGIPTCMTHALYQLNEMCHELRERLRSAH